MVDEVQGVVPQQAVSPSQAYLEAVIAKFNANPHDPELSDAERVLMGKIVATQKDISEKVNRVNELNKESQTLTQQVVHLQGQSQGFLDSLLALKSASE